MTHVDPFAPADSPHHPANYTPQALYPNLEPPADPEVTRYWALAEKYLTPAERDTEGADTYGYLTMEALEEREAAVGDYVTALAAIGSNEGEEFPTVPRPEIVDTVGEVWQWAQDEPEGESGWFMPAPVEPEPEPEPEPTPEPTPESEPEAPKRSRKKAAPTEDALAAALAKLDNQDSA